MIWIQVRDVRAEHARLAAAGVTIVREPMTEPWGLTEMWIQDPDGVRIVLVEIPAGHPLRRDPRSATPPRVTRNLQQHGPGTYPQAAAANHIRCQSTRYAVRDTLLNCLNTPAWRHRPRGRHLSTMRP